MRIGHNLLLILLSLFAALSFGVAIINGSAGSLNFRWNDPLIHQIILSIRLPRACSAFVTGGLLALAGALMQLLLRNPLADPYVLGVSGGAALATLLLLSCGITGITLIGGAWLGSFLAILGVFLLAKYKQPWNPTQVLLTGIALAMGFSALISFILLISPDHTLRSTLFWLIGDLSYSHNPFFETVILLAGLLISLFFARDCNILMRGDSEALALGINIHRLQIILYLTSSILTAAAVTLAGCIGFIGLIVPHTLRLLGLRDQRTLLPACVLLGGALLTCADTVARTLWHPQQLPVGIILTLLGIPVFLVLLQRNKQC